MYYLHNSYEINCIIRINRLDYECKFRPLSVFSSNSSADEKTNECTNAQHTVVKNGRFVNYNIFLYYVSRNSFAIFNEQIGLYYANKQLNY